MALAVLWLVWLFSFHVSLLGMIGLFVNLTFIGIGAFMFGKSQMSTKRKKMQASLFIAILCVATAISMILLYTNQTRDA